MMVCIILYKSYVISIQKIIILIIEIILPNYIFAPYPLIIHPFPLLRLVNHGLTTITNFDGSQLLLEIIFLPPLAIYPSWDWRKRSKTTLGLFCIFSFVDFWVPIPRPSIQALQQILQVTLDLKPLGKNWHYLIIYPKYFGWNANRILHSNWKLDLLQLYS